MCSHYTIGCFLLGQLSGARNVLWGQQGQPRQQTSISKALGKSDQNQAPVLWMHCVHSLADEWDFLLLLNVGSSLGHNLPADKTFACDVSLFCPQHVSQHVTGA